MLFTAPSAFADHTESVSLIKIYSGLIFFGNFFHLRKLDNIPLHAEYSIGNNQLWFFRGYLSQNLFQALRLIVMIPVQGDGIII
ncbi:hypothetical protein ES703_118589 [subsurface metagenome]